MATSTSSRSAGSSRSVCSAQLGRTARWNRRRLARAREGSDHGVRGQILMIVQCRGRRSAARARASAPTVSAADFPIVVDDPVARCARRRRRAPADHHHRSPRSAELHRRPESAPTTIPLKRNGDVDQQPQRRLEPVGLLGAARSHSSLESAASPRAREGSEHGVRGQISDDRSVPRPPQRCASESKRPHCQCCRFSDRCR